MAAERMPDFKEINRLIESLQMLDRSFQRITSEYGEHEANVRKACTAELKKQSAEFLKEIPVEELKNSKAGIRINALQSAGYNTLYDLYKAENWKLQRIDGIGEKQISSIRSIIGEFLNRLSSRARIRLTADRDDIHSRTLIHEIARFRKIEQIAREAGPLTASVHETISALTEAVPIRSRLRWIFSFGGTKAETIRAIGDILTYCRSAEYNLVKSLISQYGEAENMGVLDAMEDFKKNSASYYAIIERLTGAGAKRELVYSSVPAQLAEEIDAFALDLSGFKGNLRAYQEFGTRYILTMKRVLLGDEMGLGKTIQAIAAMTHLYRENKRSRFLVVCPASVMINWCREIQKFSDIPVNLLHGPLLEDALKKANVEIRGDENVAKIISCRPASSDDWSTEYLDFIVSIKMVSSLSEAIAHINTFGSHHTDCICTENEQNAAEFMQRVDSSGVYWNVSTRFSDGFVYGFGAEVELHLVAVEGCYKRLESLTYFHHAGLRVPVAGVHPHGGIGL